MRLNAGDVVVKNPAPNGTCANGSRWNREIGGSTGSDGSRRIWPEHVDLTHGSAPSTVRDRPTPARFYHDPGGHKMEARRRQVKRWRKRMRKEGGNCSRAAAEYYCNRDPDGPKTTPRALMVARTGYNPPSIHGLDDRAIKIALGRTLDELTRMHIGVEDVENYTAHKRYAFISGQVLDSPIADIPRNDHLWDLYAPREYDAEYVRRFPDRRVSASHFPGLTLRR